MTQKITIIQLRHLIKEALDKSSDDIVCKMIGYMHDTKLLLINGKLPKGIKWFVDDGKFYLTIPGMGTSNLPIKTVEEYCNLSLTQIVDWIHAHGGGTRLAFRKIRLRRYYELNKNN